jgi:hypothetical protein
MPLIARLAVAAFAVAFAAPAPAQTVAVIGNSNQFGYFNLSTRQYTQISGSIAGGVQQVTNLAYDGTNLFITDRTNTGTQLKTLSVAGVASASRGTILVNGQTDEFIGLSFGNGTLYSTDFNNERLTTISRTDAATTQPGVLNYSTEPPISGKLAFVGPTLYGTITANGGAANGLYSFNLATGAGTLLGNGGAASTYTNMIAFSNAGTLYGINGTTLYTISTANGNLTTLGAITGANVPTQFVAAVVAPVPEPATALGVAAAGLGLARLVRRRRAAA